MSVSGALVAVAVLARDRLGRAPGDDTRRSKSRKPRHG